MLALKEEPVITTDEMYTYEDYLSWDEDFRAEIIDGKLYMMSTPTTNHQRVLTEFLVQLHAFLKDKPCQVFPAPFSVRLEPEEKRKNKKDNIIVEPDIVVICDKSKIDKNGCNGAPDFVIEILSPSTVRKDTVIKLNKYLNAGVREYWLAEPESKTVMVCVLENGKYVFSSYDDTGDAPVSVLPGCKIDLKSVFAEN
ncbi:hypothetical protein FACS1894151_06810 [Spirochaetia bacterium]|nr:hypothetical protein FACS1894151_06810 [Spirochaetia bacterium]